MEDIKRRNILQQEIMFWQTCLEKKGSSPIYTHYWTSTQDEGYDIWEDEFGEKWTTE